MPADKSTELSRSKIKTWSRPYDQRAFSPLDPTAGWLSHLALAIYMCECAILRCSCIYFIALLTTMRPSRWNSIIHLALRQYVLSYLPEIFVRLHCMAIKKPLQKIESNSKIVFYERIDFILKRLNCVPWLVLLKLLSNIIPLRSFLPLQKHTSNPLGHIHIWQELQQLICDDQIFFSLSACHNLLLPRKLDFDSVDYFPPSIRHQI